MLSPNPSESYLGVHTQPTLFGYIVYNMVDSYSFKE